MSIVITGADSFIGHALRKACQAQGIEVIGVDARAIEDSEVMRADIRDPGISDLVPTRCDAIVHLAALSSERLCQENNYQCFDVNVLGTLNMVNVARVCNVKQFIFMSTEWVYTGWGDDEKNEEAVINIAEVESEYALSKLVSENNLRQEYGSGFCDTTILRLGIVYGSERVGCSAVESLFFKVGRGEAITVGSLHTARRFIHVSDVADAIIVALGLHGFQILNIQGPREITLGEVIEHSAEIWGVNPTVEETDPFSPSVRRVSSLRASSILRWQAEVDLKEGLRRLL